VFGWAVVVGVLNSKMSIMGLLFCFVVVVVVIVVVVAMLVGLASSTFSSFFSPGFESLLAIFSKGFLVYTAI